MAVEPTISLNNGGIKMGLSKEEQRQKHREAKQNEPSNNDFGKVKRFINGELKMLSKKQNRKMNKKNHKPPKIYYGHNTNK